MKLVVFSDIHGNSDALKELLIAEPPVEGCQYIFCGDIVGYYYKPKECIDILKKMVPLISVRGNHDQMYLDSFFDSDMTNSLIQKYGSSYKNKDMSIAEYLSNLPLQCMLTIEGKDIIVQHGAPDNLLEGRIYPDTRLGCLDTISADIVLFGHTHYRMHKIIHGQTHWINAGSLGQPRDGLGFSYCVIKTEPFSIEFKRIKVNIEDLKRQAKTYDFQNPYLWEVFERERK